MQNENENPLPPMQIGADAEQSARLVEEIKHTGVAESQDAAQTAPAPNENMTPGDEPPSIPTPIITRS